MLQRTFKLTNPVFAISSEQNQGNVVVVPANAVVTVVVGDVYGEGFLKIRHLNQSLDMLAADLRNSAGLVLKRTA